MLDEAARIHPGVKWWIKSDGTDVLSGLIESVRGDWTGDVDVGDDTVKKQHQKYLSRQKAINGLNRNLCVPEDRDKTVCDFNHIKESVSDDLNFIPKGACDYLFQFVMSLHVFHCMQSLRMPTANFLQRSRLEEATTKIFSPLLGRLMNWVVLTVLAVQSMWNCSVLSICSLVNQPI